MPSRPLGLFARLRHLKRDALFREFLGFGSTSVFVQVSRVATGLVAASLLGPAVWGSWYLLNLIIAYGALTHLGVLNGMNREVPSALGRGDPEEAVAMRRVALATVLVTTTGVAATLLVTAVFLPSTVSLRELALVLVLLVAHQAFGYATMCLKATTRFLVVARLQLVQALAYPLCCIAGAWMYGLPGFIAGQIVTYAIVMAVALRHPEVVASPWLDWERIRALVRIGFPIMLVGVVNTLFMTVDRWIVVAFMGTEPLGVYSLAIMALGAVGLLPQVIAQQFYPRMAYDWAAHRDTRALRELATGVRRMVFAATLPVAFVALLVVPPAVHAFLPAYAQGIPALLVTIFVPVIAAVGQGYGGVLHMLDRQVWLLVAIVVAACLNAGFSALLVGPFGLVGVAWGTLAAFVCLSALRVGLGERALAQVERGHAGRGPARGAGAGSR